MRTTDKLREHQDAVGVLTTGIGSLPHHNIDSALEQSFLCTIPYLPQIPIRNPWEFMIAQSLEGIPGLTAEKEGLACLSLEVWEGRSHWLSDRLSRAFASFKDPAAFDGFEPSAATCSSWQPFLWELEERKCPVAKIQIAGPITCQLALRLSDGTSATRHAELASQITEIITARSIAMIRRLKKSGIHPVLYIDEPGLMTMVDSDPRHKVMLRELGLLIHALRREEATVGLHCCSDPNWQAVFALELDVISFDVRLSLARLKQEETLLRSFSQSGGVLSYGIIPTDLGFGDLKSFSPQAALQDLKAQLSFLGTSRGVSIYTPACGLALHSVTSADAAFSALHELAEHVIKSPG